MGRQSTPGEGREGGGQDGREAGTRPGTTSRREDGADGGRADRGRNPHTPGAARGGGSAGDGLGGRDGAGGRDERSAASAGLPKVSSPRTKPRSPSPGRAVPCSG